MTQRIRQCLPSELETLRAIGIETYDETFRSMNRGETMDRYLEEAFSAEKLAAELSHAASRFFFMYADDELAGYSKLNEAPAQTDINDDASLEVERIYIRTRYKGRGLGTRLMNHALDLAKRSGKDYVWLGVWENNKDAILFYKRMGFSESGRHHFRMGDELQSDIIMKKVL